MTKIFFWPLIFFLFLAGCSQKEIQKDADIPQQKEVDAMPGWYTHPPENSDTLFYGIGRGTTPDAAAEAARKDLNERISDDLLARCRIHEKRVKRYLTESQTRTLHRRLEKFHVKDIKMLKSERRPEGYIVLVGAGRADLAKPLKRKVIRRLVPIEERWHAVRTSNILVRYKTLNEAKKKIRELLPDYLVASAIEPFSKNITSRVEEALPYFDRMERSLKKRLSFCIEPAETPALELFSEAVEKALTKENYPVVTSDGVKKDTICILVEGVLDHHSSADTHMLSASIDLKLREPHRHVIEKRHYVVTGTSSKSGMRALQKATQALEKQLREGFPFSE
ncbi:LPP20 family lipoprotein [Hydrogenimonas urashimensis]|uniref:LPP20 family lipoprotein n=1 Tax=Hydrogenimonas urashimensis TaxID=2740515 RepID=UPI001915ABA3|nr:LPP20 family lipoprotein [Hydrogenimonas urashimensis]